MTPRIAIIADDLTGALDTGAPFALRGLAVAVPLSLDDLDEALAAGPEVIAVNTASRALGGEAAAAQVAGAARRLADACRPGIVFKKIDSRLKGNIAAECAALARAMGFRTAVIAPAVPDQGRFTIGGAVTGLGIGAPLAIAPVFAGLPLDGMIRDARTDGDLDAAVADHAGGWDRILAVGARGLGAAFARGMGHEPPAGPPHRAMARGGTLFAFGSTDPITLAQIEALRPHAGIVEAPGGCLPAPGASPLPLALRITGAHAEPAGIVAARFAEGVAGHAAALGPANLVMGGGDTALAILHRLGARVLHPTGEAAPGLPAFDIALPAGGHLRCVAKSGGFGGPGVLAGLLDSGDD